MEFDNLLRKYLSGSISDRELEQFQLLVDRVPEYKAELRDTLEIRSLLHDDALTLTPPPDLSEHIRIAVSSSFAADAIAEWEEESRKRRAFMLPLRITAGALVATCLAVGVALTPTLPKFQAALGDRAGIARTEAALGPITPAQPPRADAHGVRPHTHRSGGSIAAGNVVDPARPASRDLIAGMQDAPRDDAWMLGHEIPYRTRQPKEHNDGAADAIASNDPMYNGSRTSILENDPVQLLMRSSALPSYNALRDDDQHRELEPMHTNAIPGEPMAAEAESQRRMIFGFTAGSGQVLKNTSPTMNMQNLLYLSFNLNGSDRIGVEGGNSSYMAASRPTDPGGSVGLGIIKTATGPDMFTPPSHSGDIGMMGMIPEQLLGKQTLTLAQQSAPTTQSSATLGTEPRAFGKPSLAPPNTDAANSKVSPVVRVTQSSDGPTATPQPTEQQLTYGGVFYDRRIQLNNRWDLCGRLTVGAATAKNGSYVMGNGRAYAAFSPNKRLTFTMGVGGSLLYNPTVRNQKSSGNLGIFYGIETGF